MRSITRLFGALGTLADSLIALAGLIDVATGKLRQQLAYEDAGHVIEHVPAEASAEGPTASAKRGKGKGAA